MCGTWKPRAGAQIPSELTQAVCAANADGNPLPGEIYGPVYADSGFMVWVWKDSAHINLLTNIHPSTEVGTLERRVPGVLGGRGAGKSIRAAPQFAIDCNINMLAVDKCDQMRGTYSPQHRSNNPWKTLFIWTLDIACVNAHALWVELSGAKVIETANRLEFQKYLVEELHCVTPGGPNLNNIVQAKKRRSSGSSCAALAKKKRRRMSGTAGSSNPPGVVGDGNAATPDGNDLERAGFTP